MQQTLVQQAESIVGNIVPPEVINKEAYIEFQRLAAHPILNEKKFVTLSDGKRISLGTATHHIEKYVADLPAEEAKQVLALRKVWNNIICKKNAAQMKAFGTIRDKNGYLTARQDKFALIRQEMIELFGRMFTAKEVHELVVNQFQIPCSLQSISHFREKHINEINAKIEEHKKNYSDVRLGYKRSRLEELSWLYITRKRIYEKTKKGEDHRLLLSTLEQLRKEIEGDTLRVDGTLNANIEITVQNHLNRELFNNFPLKELILARVAARSQTSVSALLLEINLSWYHNFLNHDDPSTAPQLPVFPSTQTYDFDRIRRINMQEANQPKQVVVITDAQVKTATSVKDALLAKLKNKSEHVNYNKEKLAAKFMDRTNDVD